jgi:hypothetical protein
MGQTFCPLQADKSAPLDGRCSMMASRDRFRARQPGHWLHIFELQTRQGSPGHNLCNDRRVRNRPIACPEMIDPGFNLVGMSLGSSCSMPIAARESSSAQISKYQVRRSASGRRGAVADDARAREVALRHSSCEADEQSGAIRCGSGGAKGGDQWEWGPATHAETAATVVWPPFQVRQQVEVARVRLCHTYNRRWLCQNHRGYVQQAPLSRDTVTGHASAGGVFPADVDFLNHEISMFFDLVTDHSQ